MKTRLLAAITCSLFSQIVHANRSERVPINSVVRGHFRYEIADGYSENKNAMIMGGYVRAIDIKNNKTKCIRRIYETKNDPNIEADAQENYITAFQFSGPNLIVHRERLEPVKVKLATFCKKSNQVVD